MSDLFGLPAASKGDFAEPFFAFFLKIFGRGLFGFWCSEAPVRSMVLLVVMCAGGGTVWAMARADGRASERVVVLSIGLIGFIFFAGFFGCRT